MVRFLSATSQAVKFRPERFNPLPLSGNDRVKS